MIGGLWRKLKGAALADLSVLVRGLDSDLLERVERILVEADFGPVAYVLLDDLRQALRRAGLKGEAEVRRWLVERITGLLGEEGSGGSLNLGNGSLPAVWLLLGVNGVGKTTVAAKLGRWFLDRGRRVLLAAADTYRAAAAEQLRVWAERLSVPCVTGELGGDPAAVAFNAIDAARARGIDLVIVDTAGRLHTRSDLVEELRKIHRVIARRSAGGPHETFLLVDATTGQNAVVQARTFTDAVPVTGLVVTKLDGSAKGGSVVAIRHQLSIPIRFLGVGEGLNDLQPFSAREFAEQLLAD